MANLYRTVLGGDRGLREIADGLEVGSGGRKAEVIDRILEALRRKTKAELQEWAEAHEIEGVDQASQTKAQMLEMIDGRPARPAQAPAPVAAPPARAAMPLQVDLYEDDPEAEDELAAVWEAEDAAEAPDEAPAVIRLGAPVAEAPDEAPAAPLPEQIIDRARARRRVPERRAERNWTPLFVAIGVVCTVALLAWFFGPVVTAARSRAAMAIGGALDRPHTVEKEVIVIVTATPDGKATDKTAETPAAPQTPTPTTAPTMTPTAQAVSGDGRHIAVLIFGEKVVKAYEDRGIPIISEQIAGLEDPLGIAWKIVVPDKASYLVSAPAAGNLDFWAGFTLTEQAKEAGLACDQQTLHSSGGATCRIIATEGHEDVAKVDIVTWRPSVTD